MNYHLTKSNPNTFRLQDCLDTCLIESRWTVCKDAKPGDILFIGQAGVKAGIYARAIVASTTTLQPSANPKFYSNPEEARKQKWRAKIEFSQKRTHRPILEENLVKIPKLKRIARWLHIQGAARHLTKEEGEAIDRLIGAS